MAKRNAIVRFAGVLTLTCICMGNLTTANAWDFGYALLNYGINPYTGQNLYNRYNSYGYSVAPQSYTPNYGYNATPPVYGSMPWTGLSPEQQWQMYQANQRSINLLINEGKMQRHREKMDDLNTQRRLNALQEEQNRLDREKARNIGRFYP